MERRKALTLAGSAAMVVAAGGIAMAANFGVLGVAGAGDGSVGTLDANNVTGLVETTTTSAVAPQVVYIDQYDVVPGDTAPTMDADDHSGSNDEPESADDSQDDEESPTPNASTPTPTPTATPSPTVTTSHRESDDDHEHEDEPEHEDEHEDD